MRIAVRSRYTNINGGYEESGKHQGRPAFRRTTGDTWIFHQDGLNKGSWHFGPALPSARGAAVHFSCAGDATTPQEAAWPPDSVEKVWECSKTPASKAARGLWEDKDFPPAAKSIGNLSVKAEWVPVRELREGTWKLFDNAISPQDLLQGQIGNCWLVAAMASLAEFPDAVEALFLQRELTSDGRCQVKLHDARCRMVTLAVDEFIPCHPREWWDDEGTPLFARPNGNEAWVLLLEKAFAKMLGSYTALSGGNCCSAFRAFTGENSYVWARSEGETARVDGEWKKMQLAEGEDYFQYQPGLEERRDAENLWEEVRGYDRQSFLIACSMRAKHGQEHLREDGLVEAHAYSLLHAVDVEGQRLVFLRNPWGNDKRWNGRWCDGDEAWDRFPSLRKRLRPKFRSDGAFWMAWVDFQASFDFVFVCPKTMRSAAAASEHRRRSEMGEVPAPAEVPVPRRRIARALPERLPQLSPGSRVELMGDTIDLDGALFEVVAWDEASGLYQLRSVPPNYWTCPKCGEVNKQSRSSCNVCGGDRDGLVPGATPRDYRVRPECVILPAGTEVALDGLRNVPELNGQEGVIVAFDSSAGRYHVRLADGGVRAIRPPHVVARRPPKQQEFSRWVAPVEEPSFVDEPESPEEASLDNDDDFDRLVEALDERLRLKKDVEASDRRWRLRRGQRLLPEGEMKGKGLQHLQRGGELRGKKGIKIRFVRAPAGGMFSYLQAIRSLEMMLDELLAEAARRPLPTEGCFRYGEMNRPGWQGPNPAVLSPSRHSNRPRPAKGGWAGWVCPECSFMNEKGTDFCQNCV